MSKLFVQVERVEDLMGRVDNYFGGGQVMTEYIKREDALKAMEWKWAGKAAFDAVKAIPSADVVDLDLSPVCYNCDGKTKDGVRTEQCLWVKGDNSKCIAQGRKLLDVVERKRGKWIDYKCSECGEPIPISKVILRGEVMWERDQKPNFCPNCGAKMESEGEND